MGECSKSIKKVKLSRLPSKFDFKKCLKFKKIHPGNYNKKNSPHTLLYTPALKIVSLIFKLKIFVF